MTDGITDFHVSFASRIATLGNRMDELARNVAFRIAENVVVGGTVSPGTPIATGYARNSWMISLGAPGEYRQPPRNPNPKGGDVPLVALEEGLVALASMRGDAIVYITSNAEYMVYLEHGTARMPPVGMIALTVAGARQLVDEVVAEMLS